MEPRHTPIVRIDGKPVATGWELNEASLLEEVTIHWGQDTIYEEVPPAILKVELLWPSGGTIRVHQLQGASIEVELPELGRYLYRGEITTTRWEEFYVWDEKRQDNRLYWLVKLTAHDIIGRINAFIPTPRDCVGGWESFSPDHNIYMRASRQWPFFGSTKQTPRLGDAMPTSVRDDLVDAGIVAWFSPVRKSIPGSQGFRTFTEPVDAWQLMREVYGTTPLGEPAMNQHDRTIEMQQPTEIATGIRLTYTGGKLQIAAASNGDPITGTPGAVMLSADRIVMASDPFGVDTDQTLSINSVDYDTQVATTEYYASQVDSNGNELRVVGGYAMSTEKRSTAVPGATGNARAYARSINMRTFVQRTRDGGLYAPEDINTNQTIAQHLTNTRNIIAKLNGRIPLPEVVVDLETDREELPAWVWPLFLSIDSHRYTPHPIIVTGSPMVQELSLSNSGQVIGGTLTYRAGWSHVLRFAPVQNELAGDLRVDQIVTHATATYDDYADDVTFGDLGLITQGAS